MDRKGKEQIVAELHDRLLESDLTVLTGYSGMSVERMTSLRNALRKSNTEVRVVKNKLLSIAARDTDVNLLSDFFRGPLAITLSRGDVVEPTKALVEFAKKNTNLEIKYGVLDGKLLTRDQISALAELPSREILLGKLLSVMVGVQTSLVTVLSAVPRGFVQVLNGYREKRETIN
ncbi:MAG: 50S ribosomal protein L10 [Smithellaceae bacterium]|nr:50S ribosomal protein L10 [Smithellaceae bacterium]